MPPFRRIESFAINPKHYNGRQMDGTESNNLTKIWVFIGVSSLGPFHTFVIRQIQIISNQVSDEFLKLCDTSIYEI